MLERLTDQAREALTGAQAEVRELRFAHVGSEGLLLGLLRVKKGLAFGVLTSFGLTLEVARAEVLKRVSPGDQVPDPGEIPLTPRAEELLERALREALSDQRNYVNTEHLLLAMAWQKESEALTALRALGVEAAMIRDAVMKPSWVSQDQDVARVMRNAVVRAVDDGRTEITARDLLIAVVRDLRTSRLLAEVSGDEAAIRDARDSDQGNPVRL